MTAASWYVASFADGQTHLADLSENSLVTAHCDGRQFRPLAALTGTPPDKAQVCSTCRAIHVGPGPGMAPQSR